MAALTDFGFNFEAFIAIMINNLATAASGVLVKLYLSNETIDKNSIVFYNVFYSIIPLMFYTFQFNNSTCEISEFPNWNNPYFLTIFILSSPCAYLLHLSK